MTLSALPITGHTPDGRPIRRIRSSADMLLLEPRRYDIRGDRPGPTAAALRERDPDAPIRAAARRILARMGDDREARVTDLAAGMKIHGESIHKSIRRCGDELGLRIETRNAISAGGQVRRVAFVVRT